MEGGRIFSLVGVMRIGKIGDENPLRGGELVCSREGAPVTDTPLRFNALPRNAGGDVRVVEWVTEGDREALGRGGVEVIGEDVAGVN
jgi:hypothetical protein